MSIRFNKISEPATPPAGKVILYVDATDGLPKSKDENGVITVFEPGEQGDPGPAGQGVPVGGTSGQVLAKVSSDDYDTEWVNQSGGGTWGSISGDLSDQTDLQTELDGKASISHTHIKADITDFDDADYASAAQGSLADSALQASDIANFETTTELNARDNANRDRANHTGSQNVNTINGGGAFNLAGFDASGNLIGIGGFQHNSNPANGLNFSRTVVPEDTNNFRQYHQIYANYNPTVTDSQETWQHFILEANIGDNASGNQLGNVDDSGGLIGLSVRANSRQSSDFNEIRQVRSNTQLGSGSSSVSGRFVEGYQSELNFQSESTVEFANFYVASISSSNDSQINQNLNLFTAFGQAPNNAGNFTGFSTNVNHRDFQFGTAFADFSQHTGNGQGYTSINLSPNLDQVTNNFTGLNINPNVNSCQNYQGIVVNTANVNTFTGVQASLVIQDLTYTANSPGEDANNFQIEYVGGGTAGSEIISFAGNVMTVQIENGVSTATQIKSAVDNSSAITFLSVAITGTGSNTQTTFSATNLAGGEWPGQKLAAQFNGDVQINGALQFSGALSVGALNAFAFQPAADGGGQPQSIHSIISGVSVDDNVTLTTADTIGVNTACLIQIGEDASVGTAFLGIAALGLPAVVNMQSGSTVDRISGAVFALSLDAGATGGTINELSLCRAIALPNGVTAVTTTYGYDFSVPFGTFNFTNIYPFHTTENFNSYMRGGLVVGETSKDRANVSTLLEVNSTTGAFLNARMTEAQRDALTAVNGMQIYNTTSDKLQVRAGGSWVDLH